MNHPSTTEGRSPVGIAKDLVDRQHELLRRRDLGGVPDLYTDSGSS